MPKFHFPSLTRLVLLAACLGGLHGVVAADRPNIVWIVSEDNSMHYLRHYFEGGAATPAIEALAAHGLTYQHAFSNAPVCSVARTTLITGCYAPRLGVQFHRRNTAPPLPDGLKMFPAYLREAGYFTTNNSKKDYNAVESKDVWDESSNSASWRNRPDPGQPFFHFQSHNESHESSLHFNEASYRSHQPRHDPAAVTLAPYHPDTPLFRHTHARYLDRMTAIDEIVADTVAKLEEDGLLESTFIFYFGDHGGVLPRGKGYLYNYGLHVPLIVRVPEKFQRLVDGYQKGSRLDGFVSFIDFGPTVLNLAGVPMPEGVDGRPFLGAAVKAAEVAGRDTSFGYADRMDEKYDLVRSARKGRHHYMRVFQPWLPDALQNNYRYISLAFQEWRNLHETGKLQGAPRAFFEERPAELLFDCEADPHNVVNLAGDPAHQDTLREMRALLGRHLRDQPDLSFYPESRLVRDAMGDPARFGRKNKAEIARLADIADLALLPFAQARPALETALASANPWERYWAVMTCASFGVGAAALERAAAPLLEDAEPAVRLRAAEFLSATGIDPRPILTKLVNESDDPVFITEALNTVVWLRDHHFSGAWPEGRAAFQPKVENDGVTRRLNYLAGNPYPEEKRKPAKKKAAK